MNLIDLTRELAATAPWALVVAGVLAVIVYLYHHK